MFYDETLLPLIWKHNEDNISYFIVSEKKMSLALVCRMSWPVSLLLLSKNSHWIFLKPPKQS